MPRRLAPQLSESSDDQQVRATLKALSAAYAKADFERACDLFSYGAGAQLYLSLAFALFADTEADAEQLSGCAGAHRMLARIIGGSDPFADEAPSAARIDAAKVSIRGDRATLRYRGDGPKQLIRKEGHWLVGGDPEAFSVDDPPSAASLARCWRRSGAALASTRADLRFAVRSTVKAIAIKPGRVSVKGDGWRLFYTLPANGEDPGVKAILAKPGRVRTVADVEDAAAHPRVVAKARACGS